MKLFISWSGKKSRKFAEIMRNCYTLGVGP